MELLIASGADVNNQERGIFANALYAAAIGGHGLVVETLISAGADVNANVKGGSLKSALLVATTHRYENVVRMLIAAGADVDAGGPLVVASSVGSKAMVIMLLDAGADENKQGGPFNYSPLFAASHNGYEDVKHMLLAAGA